MQVVYIQINGPFSRPAILYRNTEKISPAKPRSEKVENEVKQGAGENKTFYSLGSQHGCRVIKVHLEFAA